MASDPYGNFVVTWNDRLGTNQAVMARRYDAGGGPLGAVWKIGDGPLGGWSGSPAVASDRIGNFAVIWQFQDFFSPGIAGRRYDAAGAPQGAQFAINTYTTGPQRSPDVSSNAAGDLVVVWSSQGQDGSSYGNFGQRLDRLGNPVAGEFQINTFTPGVQWYPKVASTVGSEFVVVWESELQDGSAYGVFAQVFDGSGPLGAEFRVNSYTTGTQARPAVASDANGNFVVVWHSPQDGSGYGIFGQRFTRAGLPRGAEFLVNSTTLGSQAGPMVTSDRNGNFVVIWTSSDPNGLGVFGQRFDSTGAPRGGEFAVNTWTTNQQWRPSVASDDLGNFVVTWDSVGQVNLVDVFGQRFGGLSLAGFSVDPGGNGVFEPGETIEVVTSWRNVNGAPQTVTGSASAFAGPGTPGNPTYTIVDAIADYGTVPAGGTVSCAVTGNCFALALGTPTLSPAARPVLHWDATFREDILPAAQGQSVTRLLHIGDSFGDVPRTSLYYRFIETILHHDLTGGCGGGNFCPLQSTPREQMAVFVLVAKEGAGYQPPACIPGLEMFADVAASSPFCRWIEELARRNIAGGCGGGNFCPLGVVSREQMSVFALATKEAAGYSPAPCVAGSERFADVPASSPFCKWVEELARRNIAGGCGGGNFCPVAQVTREQNSVFVSGTFVLTLY